MASSPTDIANLALGHLGEAPITSFQEDSLAARKAALHYLATRDQVLRSHRWNFAQTRKVLSRLLERPAFGWTYQYELPEDCLRVNEFNGSEAGDWLSDQYIIEGRRLLTDATEARLVYNRRIDDVSDFDALFIEALSLKLAIVLSESIRGTTSKTADLTQLYEQKTGPLARRVDANEGRRRKGLLPLNSHSIRARGIGSGMLTEPFSMSGGLGIPTETEPEETTEEMDTFTVSLVNFGEAVIGDVFDTYKPSKNLKLEAIEVTAQIAPLGAPSLTIQLVTDALVSIGPAVTLPSFSKHTRLVLSPSLSIGADTVIQARIVSVGSVTAGAGLRVNLSVAKS